MQSHEVRPFGPGSRRECGSTLVEFALVSVVFFLVVFGIFSWAVVLLRYNAVSFLAREGVRWAAVRGASSGSPASDSDVENYVESRAMGLDVDVDATWTPDNEPGSRIEVEVSTDVNLLIPFYPATTLTLESTSEMVIAR